MSTTANTPAVKLLITSVSKSCSGLHNVVTFRVTQRVFCSGLTKYFGNITSISQIKIYLNLPWEQNAQTVNPRKSHVQLVQRLNNQLLTQNLDPERNFQKLASCRQAMNVTIAYYTSVMREDQKVLLQVRYGQSCEEIV